MSRFRFAPLFVLCVVLIGMLCGCEPAIDEQVYGQIKQGMKLSEVETLMGGKGEREEISGMSVSGAGIAGGTTSSVERYIWKNKGAQISVEVKDGIVQNVGKAGF
ncbi:MAG: hypothetical protein U0640_03235 [Phycisphaerales bacterium]